ncbi:MAG: nucleoside phosphorylase [Flavobacteriaceae bacterium]|nr:nucleoside phosphorylase [Flavobacteriaceae bacterium]MDG2313951.1 nucleoside phosphorylase [Flavobacteriaceae bacterium]
MASSELILNPDGSVYHLGLLPHEIGHTILTVGDPDRVPKISKYFETLEVQKQTRELCTHTGTYNGQRITIISTGMGTDNIDIVLTELDALVNVNLTTLIPKKELTSLRIIRLGTSGASQSNIPLGSLLLSKTAIGFDNLLHFYPCEEHLDIPFARALQEQLGLNEHLNTPYVISANKELLNRFSTEGFVQGITATHPGFYGPQGRRIRMDTQYPDWNQQLESFDFLGKKISNLEMETAGIYGLAAIMGHQALSVNAIIANRKLGTFSEQPNAVVDLMIQKVLNLL